SSSPRSTRELASACGSVSANAISSSGAIWSGLIGSLLCVLCKLRDYRDTPFARASTAPPTRGGTARQSPFVLDYRHRTAGVRVGDVDQAGVRVAVEKARAGADF